MQFREDDIVLLRPTDSHTFTEEQSWVRLRAGAATETLFQVFQKLPHVQMLFQFASCMALFYLLPGIASFMYCRRAVSSSCQTAWLSVVQQRCFVGVVTSVKGDFSDSMNVNIRVATAEVKKYPEVFSEPSIF